jgi:hypothetical protein
VPTAASLPRRPPFPSVGVDLSLFCSDEEERKEEIKEMKMKRKGTGKKEKTQRTEKIKREEGEIEELIN